MNARGERAIWFVAAVLSVCLAAGIGGINAIEQPVRPDLGLPDLGFLLLVTLAVVVVELRPVHIPTTSGIHSIALSEVPLVVGLLVVPPLPLVLGTALGVWLVGMRFKQSLLKLLLNVANAGAWTVAAVLVFGLLEDDVRAIDPACWLAVLLATGLSWAGQAATIELVVGFAAGRERPGLVTSGAELLASMVVTLAAVCVTLIGAILVSTDARDLLLWLAPVWLAIRAFHQRVHDVEKARAAKFVLRATESLTRESDVETVLLDSVHHTQGVFECDAVHVFLDTPTGTRRATTGDSALATLPMEGAIRELAADPSFGTAVISPSSRDPRIAALAEGLDTTTGLVVTLRDGTDVLGALVMVGRRLRPFTEDHVLLGRELSTTVSIGLRRSWFERSLAMAQDATRAAEHRARHDPLTGLPNRLELARRLGQEPLAPATAVFFVDLDHFKAVNDLLGHDAGDAVLRTVAARLRAALRPGDLAVRHGGDEFLVVSYGLAQDEAGPIARRLEDVLSREVQHGQHRIEVRVSAGHATSDGTSSLHDLVLEADESMYARKRARAVNEDVA